MKTTHRDVRDQLKAQLEALTTQAFLRVIALLLERMGYLSVSPTSRKDLNGRHRCGGIDLTAVLPDPLGNARVVVQAKQYPKERLLFQRAVDEIRGTALRAGASAALLITTSGFSPRVEREALASSPVVPVYTISGRDLVELLILHQVGVIQVPPFEPGTSPAHILNAKLFERLTEQFPQSRPGQEIGRVTITLSLRRLDKSAKQSITPKRAALPSRS